MAILSLDPRTKQRTYRETVAAGSTSEPVMMATELLPVSVAVHPSAGATGRIEYTITSRADVEAAAPGVKWLAWPAGDTATAASDVLIGPVTAVRCVAAGGDVDWEVLA